MNKISKMADLIFFTEGNSCYITHCSHTTTATAIWVSSLYPVLRYRFHHVQFLHIITDKRQKMLGFRLIYVHQIHIVSFSFKIIWRL